MPSDDPLKTVRWRFAGEAAQVGRARRFVAGVLGEEWPTLADVTLLTSEVVSNAVQHTASGNGGSFEVAVSMGAATVRVEVRDEGAGSVPQVADAGGSDMLAGGRGLVIVDMVADRWGHDGDDLGRVIWFEVTGKAAD